MTLRGRGQLEDGLITWVFRLQVNVIKDSFSHYA